MGPEKRASGLGALALATGVASVLTLGACSGGGGGGSFSATADAATAGHVLRRAAYGPTPALLARLEQEGVERWISEQLDPASINEGGNSSLQFLLAQLPTPQSEYDAPTFDQLLKLQVARAVYSERQLQEQLTLFWDNHFNTEILKLVNFFQGDWDAATYFEWRENDLFRTNALGRFEDLLLASATSPAMLVFLDSTQNVAGTPNENYARELMELFTMGVDNGYDEDDIEEVARCFTGWTVCRVAPGNAGNPHAPCGGPQATRRWTFHFDPSSHDAGPKTLFAGSPHQLFLPARQGVDGIRDGMDVLEHLARRPQTAEFVSRKLIRHFVSDTPPPALVARCRTVWLNTGGNLRTVMRTILESREFLSQDNRWDRVESPMESLVSTVRALEGKAPTLFSLTNLHHFMDSVLGQRLFRWPDPDGYPAESELQLGTSKMLGRVIFNQRINARLAADFVYDPRATLIRQGVALDVVPSVVDYYFELFFQDRYTLEDWNAAVQFLSTDTAGNPAPLNHLAFDYDDRLRQFTAFVASYPQAFEK